MATADSTPMRLRGSTLRAGARRVASLVARIPVPLAVLLGIAIALRLAFWLEYRPAMMNNADAFAYIGSADDELFTDPARPAGYPMFLRLLHSVSDDLDFTIVFQHVMGIATALLLYATVRRIGAPVWAGVVTAAAVLLSLDQVQVEHTVLSEPLFAFGLCLMFYAAVRALDPPRPLFGDRDLTTRHAWILFAGVALGLATWARTIGAPLVPFLALWFVFALPGRWRSRIAYGAVAAAAAGALILVYFQLNSSETGHFRFTQATGWAFYSRTAPIADCSEFDPPAGTSELCQDTPSGERNGPDFYAWDPRSPAHRLFGGPPAADSSLGAFAREVVLNQPLHYVWVSVRDWARYFFPGLNDEQSYVVDLSYLDIDRRDRELEQDILGRTREYYPSEGLTIGSGLTALTELQQVLRVHPIMLFEAVVLGAIALWLTSGRVRVGLVLLLGVPLWALLFASATTSYNARYAIPFAGALIAAGTVALWVIIQRLRERGADTSEPAQPTPTT
jgi:hypothetical protein